MPKVVFTHRVTDVENWLKGKDERAAAFAPFGTDVRDHVTLDGSDEVAITVDIHDVDGVQALLTSPPPDVAALMQRHGVILPVVGYFER